MRGKELLTPDQRQSFLDLNALSEGELAGYQTFSAQDLAIIARHRRDETRLGFAVQLALLRYPGWPLSAFPQIPAGYADGQGENLSFPDQRERDGSVQCTCKIICEYGNHRVVALCVGVVLDNEGVGGRITRHR